VEEVAAGQRCEEVAALVALQADGAGLFLSLVETDLGQRPDLLLVQPAARSEGAELQQPPVSRTLRPAAAGSRRTSGR